MMTLSALKALPNTRQEQLSTQFPDVIRIDEMEDVSTYERLSISVFEKWLNASEANKLLDDVEPIVEKRRYELLDNLNAKIANSTECLTYEVLEEDSQCNVLFSEFVSVDALLKYFKQDSSRPHFRIVLPELSALYHEGFDFTNHLYFKDKSMINSLIEFVRESDLHVLNHV